MSGSKAPDFDAYGLFRATHSHVSAPLRCARHVPLAHSTLPIIRIWWDYHPTFMLISGRALKVFHPPMSKHMWA